MCCGWDSHSQQPLREGLSKSCCRICTTGMYQNHTPSSTSESPFMSLHNTLCSSLSSNRFNSGCMVLNRTPSSCMSSVRLRSSPKMSSPSLAENPCVRCTRKNSSSCLVKLTCSPHALSAKARNRCTSGDSGTASGCGDPAALRPLRGFAGLPTISARSNSSSSLSISLSSTTVCLIFALHRLCI